MFAASQVDDTPSISRLVVSRSVDDSKSGATAAIRAGIPLVAYANIHDVEEGKEKMNQLGALKMNQMGELLTEDCKAKTVMYDWKEWSECLKTSSPRKWLLSTYDLSLTLIKTHAQDMSDDWCRSTHSYGR